MKRAARFLIALLVTGCATADLAPKPSPDSHDSPEIIYAIPQSQAFAIARGAILSSARRCGADDVHIDKISGGDGREGYEADYDSFFYHFNIPRRLWVVPTAGIAESGRQIDGFRFEITYYYFRGLRAVKLRLPGGGCEETLITSLLAALQATGTATSVTNLETRAYDRARVRSSTPH
jgi:hypothetical protein